MRSSLCLIENRLLHCQFLPLHHMDALCISCQAALNPFCYSFPPWFSESQKVSWRQNKTQMTKVNRLERSNSYFMFRLNSGIRIRLFYVQFKKSERTSKIVIDIKRCRIWLCIFWYMWQVCRRKSTYSNAHAKVKSRIFHVWFPGTLFKFDIISNAFWNSIIWAIQIQVSFAGFKNPKIPGIQPIYVGINP